MDVNKLLQQFIHFLEEKGRSNSTIIAYKKDIEQLFDFLQKQDGNISLEKIDTKKLVNYVESLKQSGEFTLKTISRKINSLKTFFKYLASQKLIANDVSDPVKHPELQPQLPRILSPMEYRALRDAARNNKRIYLMVELLLQTGLRIGELSRLQENDVHLEADPKYIRIQEFSSNPEREVELNETIASALADYLKNKDNVQNSKGYLFSTKSGNPVLIRNIRTAIHRTFEKAGISNATVNDIRNTFIVYQLQEGISLERLAEIVGHQKSTTTERYLQLVQKRPKRTHHSIKPL